MDVKYIISKSLEDHDRIALLIRYLKDKTKVRLVPQKRNNNRDLWTFYDVNTNEPILETEVEYLSIYNSKLKIWCWAWSVPLLSSLNINLSKEMLLYALKLGPELSYLKSILITSRGTVVDPIQVDIHLALASYILKQPYVFPYKHPMETYMVYYYILLNTDGLNELFEKIKSEP
jgi:hypothetical protein